MTITRFQRPPTVSKRAVSTNRHHGATDGGSSTNASVALDLKNGSKKKGRTASANAAGVLRWWAHPSLFTGHAMTFIVVALLDYMIGLFLAVRMVPTMMASLASGMGVNMNSAPLPGFMVWAMSSLMVVIFMAVLGLVVMVALWRLRRRLLALLSSRVARRLGL